jgi:hypothetical protein
LTLKKLTAILLCFALIVSLAQEFYAAVLPSDTIITGLQTNTLDNPVGVEGTPSFSWRMESDVRGQAQTAYHVTLAKDSSMTDVVWDSGKVTGDISVGITCGAALESLTKYYWQTGVWDKDGNYTESGTAFFETGLLDNTLWSGAEWIQVGDETVPQRLISKLIGKEDVYDADNQAETIEYIYMVRDVLNTITKLFPKPAAIAVMTVFDSLLGRELKNFGSSTFRKEFRTENGIESAKLTITGRGIFDAFINGKRVGAIQADSSTVYDELKPGYTDVDKRAFYFTYDVTPLLSESGNNAISAIVGNSWWRDAIVSKRGSHNILKAKLFIRYSDGTTQEVATDTTWKTKTTGPVLASTIYDGEVYDANADTAWKTADYDESGWANAELNYEFVGEISSAAIGARVRVRDDLTLEPASVTVSCGVLPVLAKGYGNVIEVAKYTGSDSFVLKKGQTAVVDFGQNFAGWTQITATGPKGTVVKMRHAEMLNEKDGLKSRGNDGPGGSIYVKNLRGAEAKAIYIMNGTGEETYHPTFTYYGFRYTKITASETITVHALKGLVLTSVEKDTGSIQTSDPALNRLVQNAYWGQYSNYVSVPTDCPQRDERLGWSADTQVFSTTACYNAESYAFLRKWMQDMRDSQRSDGAFPVIAPYGKYMWHGQLGWSDAGVIVPYNLYKMYGDKTILEENYAAMQKFMDVYMASTGKVGGGNAYGDWLAYEANDDDLKRLIGIAYFAWDAQMMAEIAAVLGKTADAAKYRAFYEEEKAFFIQEYVNPDGTLKRTEQTACLMALKMELLPDESAKNKAIQTLVENIENKGNKLQTGFLGTAVILQVLVDVGRADVAYKVLLQRGNPSWLYSVDMGATTFWERWNSYTVEKGFGDPNMNSFNHYAYGAVVEWLYSTMAGIQADIAQAGFKHIILKPVPDPSLDFVNGSYDSVYGTITSRWTYEQGSPAYYFSIPANTTAAIYLPLPQAGGFTVNGIAADSLDKEEDGAEFTGIADGLARFEIVAGDYIFTPGRD